MNIKTYMSVYLSLSLSLSLSRTHTHTHTHPLYLSIYLSVSEYTFPVGCGCKIYRLHLCRGIRPPPPHTLTDHDTKQSDVEVLVMLGFWRIRSTHSLPLLPGPLWPGMIAPDRALCIWLNRTILHTYAKLNFSVRTV